LKKLGESKSFKEKFQMDFYYLWIEFFMISELKIK
jgi:hypothetical protein